MRSRAAAACRARSGSPSSAGAPRPAAGGVSEARQAAYLGAALDRALGPWRDFVRAVFVYGYDRDNGAPDDLEGHFGVRRADGSLKPAWDAVARRAG